jgi:chromosome segregation ATPase
MTSNISIDLDCAKAILETYQQVNDTPFGKRKNKHQGNHSNHNNHSHKMNSSTHSHSSDKQHAKQHHKINHKKTLDLELELTELQAKYTQLLGELTSKEAMLARLNRQLIDRTTHLEQLQQDFENAIYQFNHKLIQSPPTVNAFE